MKNTDIQRDRERERERKREKNIYKTQTYRERKEKYNGL